MRAIIRLFVAASILLLGYEPATAATLCKDVAEAVSYISTTYNSIYTQLQTKFSANEARITASARYQHRPVGERASVARLEMDGSWANAHLLAEGKMGPLAAQAYVDALNLERVIDAAIPLEDIGKGYGHIAKRLPVANADQKLADILENNKARFEDASRPYLAAGYGEAHLLRDANIIFDGETSALQAEKFVVSLASGGVGIPYEWRVAAARKTAHEKLLMLDADKVDSSLVKCDIVTDKHVYNVGLTTDTIKAKLVNQREIDAMAEAILNAESRLGVPFKFACSGGDLADTELVARIGLLNDKLKTLCEAPPVRPIRRIEIASDILVEPLR
jgi:hypothetical protein